MKNLFSILLLFVSTFGLTQNTLSFDNINVDQNTVFDLPIKIKNDNAFTAIQFDLNFNKDAFSLDSEHVLGSIAQSHTLSVSSPSDGVIRVVIFSAENKEIGPSDANLLTLKLKSKTLPGNHSVEINSMVASNANNDSVSFSVDTNNVNVNGSLLSFQNNLRDFGRVPMNSSSSQLLTINNNGTTDLVLNSNNDVSPFSLSASYPVTISKGSSVSLTINLNSDNKGTFEKKLKFESNDLDPLRKIQEVTLKAIVFGVNEIYIGSGSGEINNEVEIPITIKNQEDFTGFQFDIPLPNNIEYVENSITEKGRETDHTFSASLINSSTLRIISYSSTNANFLGNDGEVLSFKLKPNVNSGSYNLYTSNQIITNSDSENIFSDSYSGNLTVDAPRINISTSSINYGEIPIDVKVDKQITISNNGQATLNISNISINNSDFSIDKSSLTIEKGNQKSITLSYIPNKLGNISTNLVFQHNDPNQTSTIPISASIFSPNYIKVIDKQVYVGSSSFNVQLINRDKVKALQFDFSLPDGFDTKLDDINSEISDFTLSKSIVNNKFRIVIYNNSSTLIAAENNPIILSVNTTIDKSASKGNNQLSFSDLIISGSENNNIGSNILDAGNLIVLNSAPTTEAVSVSTADNTDKTIVLNGSDVDEDTLTYSLVTEPSNGSASISGNIVTYKSNANYNGSDSFTYKVNDGTTESNVSTVFITVTNTNDAPTTETVSASTAEDSAVEITLLGSDIDGDTLTYSLVTEPSNGVVSISGSTATYTPNTNYIGSDSFTYKVNDGTTDSNASTVSIKVNAANYITIQDKIIQRGLNNVSVQLLNYNQVKAIQYDFKLPENFSIIKDDISLSDELKEFSLSASDLGNDKYRVIIFSQSSTIIEEKNNPIINYLNIDINNVVKKGVYNIEFTNVVISGSDNKNIYYEGKVKGVMQLNNIPPVASNLELNTLINRDVSGSFNAEDFDNDDLTFLIYSNPENGSVSIENDTFIYTPNTNFIGEDVFTYIANDGTDDSIQASVKIIIEDYDHDNDGILDSVDLCPNTPQGATLATALYAPV